MGQTLPKPQVIEAQRFILKSQDGTVRAILGQHEPQRKVSPAGEPWHYTKTSDLHEASWGLHIFGSDGEYDAGLMSQHRWDGGELRLYDKKTASAAKLSVGPGYMDLLLSATTQSREASEWQWGEAIKKLHKVETPKEIEEAVAVMPVDDSTVHIFVSASKDTPTALTLNERGSDKVVLGGINLSKPYGVVEQRPLSSLFIFDKDGKAIWKAP